MKSFKVLVIPSWYPDKYNPINGIFFKEQAEALNRYVDVAILSVSQIQLNKPHEIICKERTNVYEEKGVLTFRYNYINWAPKVNRLNEKLYKMKIIKAYQQVLLKFGKPDIIHAHVSYPAGYAAMILSKKYNIPFIVTEHATFFERLMNDRSKSMQKIFTHADYYIAVSNSLKNRVIEAGRHQCEVIPNFINMDKFEQGKKVKSGNENNYTFINISIPSYKKGIDILLKAFQEVVHNHHHKNIHLKIIGDGPKQQEYKMLSNSLGLQDNCTFYGQVSNEELVQHLKSSDSLIISSRIETFGVVGIEAMSCGIPVLATRCGGPEDYINDDVGILVENENIHNLAKGMIDIVNNYSKYNSFNIKEYVVKNYSDDAICKRIIDIYIKVLKI